MIDLELPWGREEIIEAMVAEYLPFDLDDSTTWPYFSQVRALLRLDQRSRAIRVWRRACGAAARRWPDIGA